jgi:hypothetical protein
MALRKSSIPFLFSALILAAFQGACNSAPASGINPTPQIPILTAYDQLKGGDTPHPSAATEESPPAYTPTGTFTPSNPPTATPTIPTMTAVEDLSCVKGPNWILYEWVALIRKGEVVLLLGRAPPAWSGYYYVRKADGAECWTFGGRSLLSGNLSGLPVLDAPPLPMVEYEIKNKTHLVITEVYLRVRDSFYDMGMNLAPNGIPPGITLNIKIQAGFYDVFLYDCKHAILYRELVKAIGSEAGSRHTTVETRVTFSLTNGLGRSVCRILVHPVDGSPGFYLLGPADGAIPPGSRVSITALAGLYKILVYSCEDLSLFHTRPDTYIGPAMTEIVLH